MPARPASLPLDTRPLSIFAREDRPLPMPSLREVRAARLLSMRELAALAQVAPSTIYLIEKGRTVPRLSMVRRLAAALEVDPLTVDEFRRAIEQASQSPTPD
jgi:transcriptional regulator with XRE-family HTH domain